MYSNKRILTYMRHAICYVSIGMLMTGCKKEVLPTLPEETTDAAINFYLASETLWQAYATQQGFAGVHVNRFTEIPGTTIIDRLVGFATIPIGYSGSSPEYPLRSFFEIILYSRYQSGDSRIYLTDITNTIVLDTLIITQPKSHNDIYFMDRLTENGTDARYRLINVPADRQSSSEKTGVRFVNLSPDAGEVTCSLERPDGSSTDLSTLASGQYSDYQEFESSLIVDGLYRFSLKTKDGYKLSAGTPNKPGRNYVVLITGFRNSQQRRIVAQKSDDDKITYKNITISGGLKTEVRSTN